jgi:hypothetical protein
MQASELTTAKLRTLAGYFGDPGLRHVSRRPAGWNRRRRERSGRRRRRASGPALVQRRERPRQGPL